MRKRSWRKALLLSKGTDTFCSVHLSKKIKMLHYCNTYVMLIYACYIFRIRILIHYILSKPLEPEEVKDFLDGQGAENVVVLKLKKGLDNINSLVIASGRSTRQIRKMTEAIVRAVCSLLTLYDYSQHE